MSLDQAAGFLDISQKPSQHKVKKSATGVTSVRAFFAPKTNDNFKQHLKRVSK